MVEENVNFDGSIGMQVLMPLAAKQRDHSCVATIVLRIEERFHLAVVAVVADEIDVSYGPGQVVIQLT
jgi:hypothetical protein